MPVLILIELDGATAAQHDQAEALMDSGPDNPPPGLISHTAAVSDNGLVVADVWESMEDAERFFETLGPALGQVGVTPAQPTVAPVHHHVTGIGEDAGVVMIMEFDEFSTDEYDAISADIPDDSHPSVMHVVGVTESGGLLVVDVWGSPEEFAAFGEEVLASKLGDRMEQMSPRASEVHVHEVVPAS